MANTAVTGDKPPLLRGLAPFGHRLAGLRLEELAERVGVLEAAEVGYRLQRHGSLPEKVLRARKLHIVDLVQDRVPGCLAEAHLGLTPRTREASKHPRRIPFCAHNPSGPVANAVTLALGVSTPGYCIHETLFDDMPWRKDVIDEDVRFADGLMYRARVSSATPGIFAKARDGRLSGLQPVG